MTVTEETSDSFVMQIGNSLLEFTQDTRATPYHFAFNIPSEQEEDALKWLRKRASILKSDDEEVVDFPNWNARSIYFYDADRNIVELIIRKNLSIPPRLPFGAESFVEISEIGMPVENIENTLKSLSQYHSLKVFDGNFDKFCAVGDEHGLFIVINKHKKTWFPTGETAFPSSFKIKFKTNSSIHGFQFEKGSINSNI